MEPTIEVSKDPEGGARQPLGPVVQIDQGRIQAHLDEVVRSTVEETLNALLDAEADELCGARKYERSEGRKDTRAGSYDRHLQTKAGDVTLTVPKLRDLPFETAIIERYRRRESSVEEALIEMYLAGVSVRRVEDITQALWGTRVSASTVSDLNQNVWSASLLQAKNENGDAVCANVSGLRLSDEAHDLDGMRCALVLRRSTAFEDCLVQQVSSAPGSTILPSYISLADLERSEKPGFIHPVTVAWSANVGIADAISKTGVLCQTTFAGHSSDCENVSNAWSAVGFIFGQYCPCNTG